MPIDPDSYKYYVPAVVPEHRDAFDNRLRIHTNGNIEVWYAPLGQRTNSPSLWILGITPGWSQMKIAYEDAAAVLQSGGTLEDAIDCPKPRVAFAGSMRKNLIVMLDNIGMHKVFGLDTSADLFGSALLRTGSVLRYPVFNRGKNYTGSSPSPLKHEFLREMIDTLFAEELETVQECLIVPLGKSVEEVLTWSVKQGRLDPDRIMHGFPHPSGANGHRQSQFDRNRNDFIKTIDRWF